MTAHQAKASVAKSKHEPLTFDDVEVGCTWDSPARTVTESDVVGFAGLTGDYNPLHVDHEFARGTPFGKPIAHGLLGLSFAAGLASHSPWMRTAAFTRICEWKFLKPIYIGDTVHVHTEVLSKEPKGRGRRGLIVWKRQVINQAGEVVQEGTTETLVECRKENSNR
jgi:acyl dehydratase